MGRGPALNASATTLAGRFEGNHPLMRTTGPHTPFNEQTPRLVPNGLEQGWSPRQISG